MQCFLKATLHRLGAVLPEKSRCGRLCPPVLKEEYGVHIAFDVLPLIGCRMTGIGYCEAGARFRLCPRCTLTTNFCCNFSSRKNEEIKIQRLQPYLRENVQPHWAKASGYVYRLVSNFLAQYPIGITSGTRRKLPTFSNYIVPPRVQERPWSLSMTWCTRRFRKQFAAERGICWIPD